jgi:preprotein translocase subunit SecA
VMFQIPGQIQERDIEPLNDKGLRKLIMDKCEAFYSEKEKNYGAENMRQIERIILLTTIDQLWKDHLLAMDHLREGIGLQGYGQKDPLIEYKKQGFNFFQMMMSQITGDAIRKVFAVQLVQEEGAPAASPAQLMMRRRAPQRMQTNLSADGELKPAHGFPGAPTGPGGPMGPGAPASSPAMGGAAGARPTQLRPMQTGPLSRPMPAGAGMGGPQRPVAQPVQSNQPTVGRNDPCWCGSGKKFKKCHGA